MKSFWMGVLGSFVGMLAFVGVGMALFKQDIFEVERDGVPKFRVTSTDGVTIGSTGSYDNLVIQTTGTNAASITADAITVEHVRLTSVSVTVDIGVLGAGGRDSGLTEAANEWYFLYVITNNDGSSSNGLISESSTSPTLPSGYTKKRRVGAVRNDGSSNFLRFVQEGNRVAYLDCGSTTRIVSTGTATSFTAVSASSFIPSTSRAGIFRATANIAHSVVGASMIVRVRSTGTTGTVGQLLLSKVVLVASITDQSSTIGVCNTDSSQQVDYKIDTAPNVSGGVLLDVDGYYDRF